MKNENVVKDSSINSNHQTHNTKNQSDSISTKDLSKNKITRHTHHLVVHKTELKWSLEKCLKIAKRYASEEEWKKNAPSSYKVACARNWKDQCLNAIYNRQQTQINKLKKSA